MSNHPESPSLNHDLTHLLGRRQALFLLGGAAAGMLTACTESKAQPTHAAKAADGQPVPACTVAADETNGPFPADGSNGAGDGGGILNVLTEAGIVRSDITTGFAGRSGRASGVPLTLVINVAAHCAPAHGYAVYVWHCTADGLYSLYDDPGQNYLRGVQISDDKGQVTFKTIFPGCYSGRMTHIHIEVYASPASATDAGEAVKVTQLTFPMDTLHSVYGHAAGYGDSAGNLAQTSYADDTVFAGMTPAELAAGTAAMSGDVTRGLTAVATVAV